MYPAPAQDAKTLSKNITTNSKACLSLEKLSEENHCDKEERQSKMMNTKRKEKKKGKKKKERKEKTPLGEKITMFDTF